MQQMQGYKIKCFLSNRVRERGRILDMFYERHRKMDTLNKTLGGYIQEIILLGTEDDRSRRRMSAHVNRTKFYPLTHA